MMQYHEALELVVANARTLSSETVDLTSANTRILAEDACFDISIPPFDKSAMDGYACRKEDIGKPLNLVETIYAGKAPEKTIGKNECAKIMTGAVVPEGADCVFMKEYSEIAGENLVRCTDPGTAPNICYKGEDVRKGDVALKKGSLISSRHIPILAGAGIHRPLVFCQPVVTVFATGSELVEPDQKPLPYQIRNSNAYQMLAQLADMGIAADYRGIIQDNVEETEQKIDAALVHSDLVVLSGGVSVGEFDFIPDILKRLEFETILSKSAIKPGKPIIFAKKGDAKNGTKYCFGLAGNPVSSFVQIELYVKPFIYSLMGHRIKENYSTAVLGSDVSRREDDRIKFVPAILDNGNVAVPVDYHGSAHIYALSAANCLIEIPIGSYELKKGSAVHVRPI